METRIEIPDSLYPQLAAASSAEGLSVEAYVVEAAKERLGVRENGGLSPNPTVADECPLSELRAHLDSLSDQERQSLREASREIQAVVDQEFSKIDPELWE